MGWSEQQCVRLLREYARIGYVPGGDAPLLPPADIAPADWFIFLYLVPDGVGQNGYEVALKLAGLLGGRHLDADGTEERRAPSADPRD